MILGKDAQARFRQKFLFLQQYLRRPFRVGAIAPSGQQLARLMVKSLSLTPDDMVVELGPGTGVFTRELLAQGVAPGRLVLVESDAQFARHLRREFPMIRIVEGDAQELRSLLGQLGVALVDKIISGIPLRSLKPSSRNMIALEIAGALAAGGMLVQFSYFRASPLPKALIGELGLAGHLSGMARNNLPPAYVWTYTKAG